ncbi:FGF4 factor, partial [Mystacornis crossleyi]|nr:FGF4 factor [Mystacornis crossleyi]
PALLLGLLWPGAVRGRSPPGRLPAGPRQRRWDAALFARSVARLPAERRDAARDGDYLLGIKRLRRLYCNGTPFCPPDSCVSSVGLLEISPVERGVVSIFGVRSGLFVAMNSKGKLYGS